MNSNNNTIELDFTYTIFDNDTLIGNVDTGEYTDLGYDYDHDLENTVTEGIKTNITNQTSSQPTNESVELIKDQNNVTTTQTPEISDDPEKYENISNDDEYSDIYADQDQEYNDLINDQDSRQDQDEYADINSDDDYADIYLDITTPSINTNDNKNKNNSDCGEYCDIVPEINTNPPVISSTTRKYETSATSTQPPNNSVIPDNGKWLDHQFFQELQKDLDVYWKETNLYKSYHKFMAKLFYVTNPIRKENESCTECSNRIDKPSQK